MTSSEALDLAAEILGGRTELARLLSLSRQAVAKWRQCPAAHVVTVAQLVKQAQKRRATPVRKEDLRPDIFRGGRK